MTARLEPPLALTSPSGLITIAPNEPAPEMDGKTTSVAGRNPGRQGERHLVDGAAVEGATQVDNALGALGKAGGSAVSAAQPLANDVTS